MEAWSECSSCSSPSRSFIDQPWRSIVESVVFTISNHSPYESDTEPGLAMISEITMPWSE